VKTIALRFGNVFGPLSRHKSSVVAKFIRQAFEGTVCEIYGDGGQTRDFIYIDDLVQAVFRAAAIDLGGEVFQIASGREHTVEEIALMIREELVSMAGIDMRISHGDSRLGDVRRNFADTSKSARVLQWTPSWDLREGIRETIRYFMAADSQPVR
jgi:UDP-glucose 4-epimerase